MRTRSVTRQLAAAVTGGLLLSGCSYADFFENPKGVGIAPPSAITQFVAETTSATIVDGSGRSLTAGEYLLASVAYTNEQCHEFFDTLERFKEDNKLLNKVMSAALSAGVPLFGFSEGSKSFTRFAKAIAFATQANTDIADIYAFATFKEHLKTHVADAMTSFRQKNGISTLTRSLIGVNDFEAVSNNKVNPIDYRYNGPASCPPAYKTSVTYQNASSDKDEGTVEYELDRCRLNSFLESHDPVHLVIVRNIAAEYASLCSISHMKKITNDAFNATKTGVTGPDTSSTETQGKEESKAEEAVEEVNQAKQEIKKDKADAKAAANEALKAKQQAKEANSYAQSAANDAAKAADEAKRSAEQ